MMLNQITFTRTTFSALLFLFTALTACKKEKEDNKPPQAFTVSVTNATTSGAVLNWTEAKDPENGAVNYSVELNSQTIASGLSTTNHTLQNLSANVKYTGKVIAADGAGNKTTADFSFSTADTPAPSDFTVKADSASNKSIDLSWTASTLPGGVAVAYDVYVNGTIKVGNIYVTNTTLSALTPGTAYTVKVVAKSPDGKSIEKSGSFQTRTNTAPAAFSITETKHGFSYITLSGSAVADVDNDALTYFIVKNNVETVIPSLQNAVASFSYTEKALNANETYSVAVRVKDEFGAIATSNALSITTHQAPGTPAISISRENNKVVVQWINNTLDQFDIGNSLYYIAGNAKTMTAAQITATAQGNNTTLVKLALDPSEFSAGVAQTVKVSLNWGAANGSFITTSNTLTYTYSVYTPTTATVNMAKIKGPGTFPPQFTITFTNCVISEYASWNIQELKFDNVTIANFSGFAICDPSKIGYYTGNVTAAEYTYLKTKSTGYIVVSDAGGLHKIDFTYTTED